MPLRYLETHQMSIAMVSFFIYNLYVTDLYGFPEYYNANAKSHTQTTVGAKKLSTVHSIEKMIAETTEK